MKARGSKALERELANGSSSARRREGVRDVELVAVVVQLVAAYTGTGAAEIAATGRRSAEVARARQMAMYLVHTSCEWTLARVAAAFGRDRSTISYACRRVEDLRKMRAMTSASCGWKAASGRRPSPGFGPGPAPRRR